MREAITSPALPPAAGPFSPAVRAGDTIYVSGQVAQDPSTGKLIDGDVSAQTEQTIENLTRVLEAAGRSLDHVLRVGVFVTDPASFRLVNEVYQRLFRAPYPARTSVVVSALPLGAAVEIDAIVDGR